MCWAKGTGGFAPCGQGIGRKPGRDNPQLLHAGRDESRLEKPCRTYCAKLFGSGCTKLTDEKMIQLAQGIYA